MTIDAITEELLDFLPVPAAERLSPILTSDDIATLKHLYVESIADNTLKALSSDLGYLEAWHLAATGMHLSWPASHEEALKFLAHHLFDPDVHAGDDAHGMPDKVAEELIARGVMQVKPPHAPSTVRRRLSSWKRLHNARGLDHSFDNPVVVEAVKAAVRASKRPRTSKSKKTVTLDVLEKVLETCDRHRYAGRRDRAMLLLAFGSGGRRRSEVVSFNLEDIEPPVPTGGEHVPVYEIRLLTAKRISAEDGETIFVAGRAARALEDWVRCLRHELGDDVTGPIFRKITRWHAIEARALHAGAVNDILKQRLALAGLDPADYSAHGMRSGFLTEARDQGVPLEEAMTHTKHRSYQVASQYYKRRNAQKSAALKLADRKKASEGSA